jgi:hypothetical protein
MRVHQAHQGASPRRRGSEGSITQQNHNHQEVTMRKLPQLVLGLMLALLLMAAFLTNSLTSPTRAAKQPQSISLEEMHRSVDSNALLVQEVKEPF